jgi:hypothetical protein
MIEKLDDALYNFIQPYNENEEILDDILQETNKEPYKSPEDDDKLKQTINAINWANNLREYFFSKLKNPEWIKLLKEKNQLSYYLTSDEHYTYWHWDAFPYLLKIANKTPDEVFDVIKHFWDEIKQDKRLKYFLSKVIEIGIAVSKVKKEHLFFVAKEFLSYLKNSILPLSSFYFDAEHIANLLKTLVDFGYEKESLEIFSECLKLGIKIKDDEFVIDTKFGDDDDNISYIYDKLLNKGSKVFQQKDKELFEIYCNIIKNPLNSLSNEEKEFLNNNTNYINIRLRGVIEVGIQEANENQTSLYVIILALREVAKKLMRADRDFVLNKLREQKNKIFLYLIFNLLEVPLKIQKSSQKYDNNSELPLKLLNKYEQKKYKHIKVFSFSSVETGFPSPLKDHEMQKMSVDEIIEFLKSWEREPIERLVPLAQALEKDVKQNSRKYLDDLLKFKDNIKPIYIMNLFSGLNDVKKTENDWVNITDIGLWTLERKTLLVASITVDENWNCAYIELLRLFSKKLFKSERLQVDDKVAKDIYNIIKN